MAQPSDPRILIIPTAYWLGTRLRRGGERVQYLGAVLVPQLIWLWLVGAEADAFLAFALSFFAMICIYELGYITNDHWAQARERSIGIRLFKADPASVSTVVLILGVGVRLAGAAAAVWAATWWLPSGGVILGAYLVALLAAFLIHNSVLDSRRQATFFLIYMVRLALPLVVLWAASAPVPVAAVVAWGAYITIFSAAFAYSYAMKKGYQLAPGYLARLGGIELPSLVVASTSLVLALVLAGVAPLLTVILASLAAWHLAYWTLWGSLRFAVELRAGLIRARRVLSHCHSDFSHDASITVEDYRGWLLQDPARTFHLTDHAEDFDALTFARLKEEFGVLGSRAKIGLEFPVANQHVLAHNLSRFVRTDGLNVEQAMQKLRDNGECVIWAHPRFSLRGLLSRKYVADMLTILAYSDGIEFYNPKNVKRRRYRLMMLATSWLGGALYGRRQLYLGVDAHRPADLPRLGTWRRSGRPIPGGSLNELVS